MAIYLDTPMWPAHGTLFAHLISDESIEELHAFAAHCGIRRRAFDEDHYDVAAHRCAALVARGARTVDGGKLVRILSASGLRIPARRRNSSLSRPLLKRWNTYMPSAESLGEELIARWGESHRRYHDRTHLLAVLEALELLVPEPPRAVLLATWFHDAVYDGVDGRDEERSARLAENRLDWAGLNGVEVSEVGRLVRITAHHNPQPGDTNAELLCDADLSVLGQDTPAYQRYVDAVREEYAHVPDEQFTAGRADVVRSLLRLDPIFRIPAARRLWETAARTNLSSELARLG
ncbi:DUF4031 domain-containing protein [Arthrobacter roseus]|uniref:DUF4031 domain-containing protein n=1 Tax=Arthrobacter roseus TaxID=136274 RepID=UPI001966609F|nr:putative metal-dependent HD superfamily phosphohydrolase [Arthrobacter roseus]